MEKGVWLLWALKTQECYFLCGQLWGPLMVLHYRFFKQCSWYSHCEQDDERCGAMEFCPGPSGEIRKSPASQALSYLAAMLFEPHGSGKALLQPVQTMFGATIHWPPQLLRVFQKAVVTAFSKVWRQFVHRFLCYP